MLKLPYEDILALIVEKGGVSKDEVERRIREKMDLLSGLVSKEGAAHIVANELGINLVSAASGKMKIGKLAPGMRDLVVVGRAVQVYEVRQFDSNGRKGQVGSLIMGDETGTVRLTLWNEQAEKLAGVKQGDIVRVEGGYAKEGMRGVELHINERSTMAVNPPGEAVEGVKQQALAKRKKLNELTEQDSNVEIMGTVVQAFDPRFFEICPDCGRRARLHNAHFVCDSHGEVVPQYGMVMNIIVDDGTDTVRVACFREQAQQATGKPQEELLALRDSPDRFEQFRTDMLGQFLKIRGRVNKNAMFDRLEIVAQHVVEAKPEEELAQFEKQ